jgi:SRSO17 transposase
MTPDDVRAAAEHLVQFHRRLAPLFGKDQARDHAYTYLKGLMCCPERKGIEPIALCTGAGQVSGLQRFIAVAPGKPTTSWPRSRPPSPTRWPPRRPARPSAPSACSTNPASPRRGSQSAWVARQHNGRLGEEDNCQVGVFLIGVAPAGSALLGQQIYPSGEAFGRTFVLILVTAT